MNGWMMTLRWMDEQMNELMDDDTWMDGRMDG